VRLTVGGISPSAPVVSSQIHSERRRAVPAHFERRRDGGRASLTTATLVPQKCGMQSTIDEILPSALIASDAG